MISALVFDLDDTLYPEREFVRSGFVAVDEWLRAQRGVTGFAAEAGRLFARGERGRIFDDALRTLDQEPVPDLVATLVEVYRAHVPRLALYPDAHWALRHFGARFKLGLVTDGYLATQRNKVAALGIAPWFGAVVYTDEFGREHWKPSPEGFRRVEQVLGCSGNACVYVGDNPAKDFVAPNRLDWRTVHLRRDTGEYGRTAVEELPADHRAGHRVNSLRELEEIFS